MNGWLFAAWEEVERIVSWRSQWQRGQRLCWYGTAQRVVWDMAVRLEMVRGLRSGRDAYAGRVNALHRKLGVPADYARRGLPFHREAWNLVAVSCSLDGEPRGMTPVTRPPWLVMQAAAAGMIPGASGRQVTLAPGRMAVGASPNTRLVIEGIVFILRTGCQWKALPLNVTEVQEAVLDAIEIERANPPRRRRKHLYADVGYTGAPALKVIKDGYIPGCQGTRTRGCRTQTLSQEESQAPGG